MTKLEQVTPLSIDRDGYTYRDREGNWLDRDEAIADATIDLREAYARGVEDMTRAIGERFVALGLPGSALMATQERDRLLQRMEAMKNGK